MDLQRADFEGLFTDYVKLRPELHICAKFNHPRTVAQHGAVEWPDAAVTVGDFTETNSSIELSHMASSKFRP
jgi:hypothetical protein